MKRATTASALVIAITVMGAASGAAAKTTCVRGSDAREIEVVTPGVVGQSCDVRYVRGGGSNVSVPYHADNSSLFCSQKAEILVNRLAASGFVCTMAAPALRAEVDVPASDYVVEAKREESQPAPAAQTLIEEPAPVVVANVQEQPSELVAAIEPSTASFADTADESVELEDEMSKILALPPLEEASGEPAQLVAQRTAPPSRPQPSVVGRLVGAEPQEPSAATTITQASLQDPAQTLEQSAEPQQAAPTPEPRKAAPKPSANNELRTPAGVIRATLRAQAAAWNEGDLDGFMGSYWKSDELKFVSGVDVTKGWNATMKRYRDRYSGGEGLGQLGFDKLDVEVVTEDIAVVTGRFNLARGGETSGGVFSLVMRRDAGAWRIVHDHTSADPE